MRQRNVKNKDFIINNSRYVILSPKEYVNSWSSIFQNDYPIYVEIGMGKGDFIIENAKRYPNINFIGIEKYDSILALALKKMEDLELPNLKIIRMDAAIIPEVFHYEVDKIFLNFSDPWPKKRHTNRRLTSECFLKKYDTVFKKDITIEMKTDNRKLFEYSLISFSENDYYIKKISLDLHNSDIENNILTEYERKFSLKGNPIYYVKVWKKIEKLQKTD